MTGQNSFWFANPSTDFYNGVIDQSLRYNYGDSPYLTRTADSGNRRTFTFSSWFKRSSFNQTNSIFGATLNGNNFFALRFRDIDDPDGGKLQIANYSGSFDMDLRTSQVFRDLTNWYHIVVAVDTTQATDSDRVKLYVNGSQVTSFSTATYPSQNFETRVSNGHSEQVGAEATTYSYIDGYLAEVNLIDGTALTPSSFGESKNGTWVPIAISGLTYGTNGFRLTFADSSSLGDDTSGNGNDFTSSGLASTDVVLDSPENNFCTINGNRESLVYNGSVTFSEGNLQSVDAGTTYSLHWTSTFEMTTGKWYWEVLAHTMGGSAGNIGICNSLHRGGTDGTGVFYDNTGKRNAVSYLYATTTYGASYTNGDIIGVAFDADNETVTFYKNNSSQGAVGSVLTTANGGYFAAAGDAQNATTYKYVANFGQDSSFAGNKTAQGNTDDNGVGDFYYSPPSGYLALCSSNLPDPTLSPNQTEQATDYFNTVLYTGNGTGQTISGVGFQPDWTWNKNRDATDFHIVQDSSRGAGKEIFPNDDADEETYSTSITSWNTDGFVLGSREPINANGEDYVSWNWKANGGTTTSDSTGSLTVSRQTSSEAQFSIITGTTSNVEANDHTETFGHGLSGTPDFILLKPRSLDNSLWSVWTSAVAINDVQGLVWNNNNGLFTNSSYRTIQVTSTLVKIGRQAVENNSTTFVCYAFKEIEGYSRFGTYESNNAADGSFVYTGFRPAFLMTKDIDRNAMSWIIYDNKRDTFNEMNNNLNIGTNTEPYDSSNSSIDFLSNGFKFRDGSSSWNNYSTETYIYMAFAAQPFKFSNAR